MKKVTGEMTALTDSVHLRWCGCPWDQSHHPEYCILMHKVKSAEARARAWHSNPAQLADAIQEIAWALRGVLGNSHPDD